nr:antitoxin endoai [[Bacillus] enclensis]
MPQQLVTELDGFADQENVNRNEFIYRATKMYLRERKKRQLRESMRRGYMEMAKINLAIASEAIQAEYEAEHTVERLVSGG